MLFIRHLLDILMNADIVEVSFVRSENGDVVIYTPITDYSCCPNSLEHLSLYEFTSTNKKIIFVKQLLFKEPHPQWASHFLKAQTFILSMFSKFNYQIYHKRTWHLKIAFPTSRHYLYCINPFATSTTSWVMIFHGNTHFNHTTNQLPCKFT
jgi:hypothetical protein